MPLSFLWWTAKYKSFDDNVMSCHVSCVNNSFSCRELKSQAELNEMDALTRQIEENKVRDYIRSRRVEQYQEEQHPTQVSNCITEFSCDPSRK